MSTKRTPEQIWKELADQARDEQEVEKLASMSDADLDRELAAAGLDPEQEKAEAAALRKQLERSVAQRRAKQMVAEARRAASEPPPRERRRRRPVVFWLAAAATTATAGAALAYVLTHPGNPGPPPPAPTPSAPAPSSAPQPDVPPELLLAARTLRRNAFVDCNERRWKPCLEQLDEARRIDPAGDATRDVQEARDRAAKGMEDKRNPPP